MVFCGIIFKTGIIKIRKEVQSHGGEQTHKNGIYFFIIYLTVLSVAQIIQPSSGRMITEK
jgi:hypothetical protein